MKMNKNSGSSTKNVIRMGLKNPATSGHRQFSLSWLFIIMLFLVFLSVFAHATECDDGIDNDLDGDIDLADADCMDITDDSEATITQCNDGDDNDMDGNTDMDDLGCSDPSDDDESDDPPQCNDGVDNDMDGNIDLADAGCEDDLDNDESDDPAQCADGVDNDMDGNTDMADLGCSDPSDDDESDDPPQCADGVDNDLDGNIDLADAGCEDDLDNDESDDPVYQCNDGIDNDLDGNIDLADAGCDDDLDDDESDEPVYQCNDGVDNDLDGDIDLADSGCNNATDDDEGDGPPLPPLFLNNSVTVTNEGALINASFNDSVTIIIFYGLNHTLIWNVSNSTYSFNHTISLTGLSNSTLYFYQINYTDILDGSNTSAILNFTTLESPPSIPNIIDFTVEPTDEAAWINVTSNEDVKVRINYGLNSTLTWTETSGGYANYSSLLLSGLQNSTVHFFKINITNIHDGSNVSILYNFTTYPVGWPFPDPPPAPPLLNLSVSATNETALINVTSNESFKTIIWYGLNYTLLWNVSNDNYLAKHSVLISGLLSFMTYFYRINITDVFGGSNVSLLMNFTTNHTQHPPSPPRLMNLSVIVTNETAMINLSSNESVSLILYYGLNSTLQWNVSNSTFSENHSLQLSDLLNSTMYYYRVNITNSLNGSNKSSLLNFTTLATNTTIDLTVPSAPAFLNINASVTNESALLNISSNESVSIIIFYGLNSTLQWNVSNSTFSENHSLQLSDLLNSTMYYYRVNITNSLNGSNQSSLLNFTTLATNTTIELTVPSAPAFLNITVSVTNTTASIDVSSNEGVVLMISYGLSPTLTSNISNLTYASNHSILLTGLSNSTMYYYRVNITNALNGSNQSSLLNFSTLWDYGPVPTVTDVIVTMTNQSATFNFTSTVSAKTRITYGTSQSSLTGILTSGTYIIGHSHILGSLQQNTTYYYRINTTTARNASYLTGILNFTTDETNFTEEPIVFTIVNLTLAVTNTTVTFDFISTYPAMKVIYYGESSGDMSNYVLDIYNRTSHHTAIGSLSVNTTHYYIIWLNASGDIYQTAVLNFTTLANPVVEDEDDTEDDSQTDTSNKTTTSPIFFGTTIEEPAVRDLVDSCEKWTCTDWSECDSNSYRYRTCKNEGYCASDEGKPSEVDSCGSITGSAWKLVDESKQDNPMQAIENEKKVIDPRQSSTEQPQGKSDYIEESSSPVALSASGLILLIGLVIGGFLYYKRAHRKPPERVIIKKGDITMWREVGNNGFRMGKYEF